MATLNQSVLTRGETNEKVDLTKQYFKLLQALHHLDILRSAIDTYPIAMTRKVFKPWPWKERLNGAAHVMAIS